GAVDLGTFAVLESTNALFVQAVRSVLPRLHFAPAQLGAHSIGVTVRQPFVFVIRAGAWARGERRRRRSFYHGGHRGHRGLAGLAAFFLRVLCVLRGEYRSASTHTRRSRSSKRRTISLRACISQTPFSSAAPSSASPTVRSRVP